VEDSVSGQVLAAIVDKRLGSGSIKAGFQWQWGDVENAMKFWPKLRQTRLSAWTSGKEESVMKPVSMTIKFGVAALLAALAQAPSAHATETPAPPPRASEDIGANRASPWVSNLTSTHGWLASR